MDLLVECPIHLGAVSIKDILVFKCGHGFCQPCLEEHFAHNGSSSGHLSCPTCRNPVGRREAFALFLSPAHPLTGATQGSSAAEAAHARLIGELVEAKAAHASCSGRFAELEKETDVLRRCEAQYIQTVYHLRTRYEQLEERFAKEADSSARAREERGRLKEEVVRLQVENHKTSKALDEVSKEVQVQLERVKTFQGYIEQYKHKCNLERKKRKALESANRHLLSGKEEESLMVVDANAPDVLNQDGPAFGWLDEACKVNGDRLDTAGDEDLEPENESEDEVRLGDPNTKGNPRGSWSDFQTGDTGDRARHLMQDQALKPLRRFPSDWNLALDEPLAASGISRKRRRVGGTKIVKVKVLGQKLGVGGPLSFDRQGNIKGTVAVGSKRKLDSKN